MPDRGAAPTAVGQAYDALMAFIEATPEGGRLPPERRLAAKFGVSRGTLRTAIDRLMLTGYLEVKHGAGIVVRRPAATTLALPFREVLSQFKSGPGQLLELRRIIEPRLAGLAARRRDDAAASSITAQVENDAPGFYVSVARASGNDLAAELVALLVALSPDQAAESGAGAAASLEALRRLQRAAVAAAIRARNAGSARDAMAAHLRSLWRAQSQR
ncbi:MAG TPA: GntR family transcriptional regulator [Trueperaceae bacterium]|nr:GntR family transcriptional regulator [Trueperaceae bacterium]